MDFSTGSDVSTADVSSAEAKRTSKTVDARAFDIVTDESRDSLLTEFGKTVATSVERQSHLFRITADRPAGASGDVGQVSMGAKSPLQTAGLSFDGRLR